MNTLSKHSTGLVLGSLIGLWHLAWACLVAAGYAQSLIDWVFRMHFIRPAYVITPFEFATAGWLILFTMTTGYVLGWLFAAIWNWLHMPRQAVPTARPLDKAA